MNNSQKKNRVLFYIGIAGILTATVLLLGNFMEESTFPIFLGIIGILCIGTSKVRLLQ